MFDILASYGITPTILQLCIVGGFVIFLIGMFWRYILIGAGLVFCVYVFAMPSIKETKTNTITNTIVTEEKDDTPPEYIQDCMRLTGKNDFDCRMMWHDRENIINE
jgi:cell division protein FtsW (lipid II flippase)